MHNREFFQKYIEVFYKENSKLNLISKNDEKFLWEKHIYDSLSIEKFFEKYTHFIPENLLDIGCGGGFPSVPVALCYPNIKVTALDSIRKKINAVENIKSQLNIENLYPLCERAENINGKFDMITSRAVASLDKLCAYALPLLDGYFAAYKSVKVDEEIKKAQNILKSFNAEVVDVIEYKLPLKENFTRNLVIIRKISPLQTV